MKLRSNFEINDYEVQEGPKGFGVYGPSDKFPRKVFKTLKAAKLFAIRASREDQASN